MKETKLVNYLKNKRVAQKDNLLEPYDHPGLPFPTTKENKQKVSDYYKNMIKK